MISRLPMLYRMGVLLGDLLPLQLHIRARSHDPLTHHLEIYILVRIVHQTGKWCYNLTLSAVSERLPEISSIQSHILFCSLAIIPNF